jgi:hypothetical protein
MSIVLFFAVGAVISVLVGYMQAWHEVTGVIGRTISRVEDNSFHDGLTAAVTPPWTLNLYYVSFALAIAMTAMGFVMFGWWGIAIAFAFFFLTVMVKMFFFPSVSFEHCRRARMLYFYRGVVRSATKRYRRYFRHGDHLRAAMVVTLLGRLHVPGVSELAREVLATNINFQHAARVDKKSRRFGYPDTIDANVDMLMDELEECANDERLRSKGNA